MVSIPGVSPFFMWAGYILLIGIFLALDLGVFNKKKHVVSIKEALTWTGVWIGISLLFGLFVYLEFGQDAGLKYIGGYLLEKSLSVDNIFVIFLIFASFKIKAKYQHEILFWGIAGAIIMRGLLIYAGAALVEKFAWVLYIFGIFLIYSGIHLVFKKDKDYDPHEIWIVRMIKKVFPVSRKQNGKFFVKEKGKFAVTIFLIALIVIEFTDVVFAFDSIPAIFGITTDPFIIFTSNIFAILGLRSLYFVVARIHDLFVYLNYGLAFILFFIGMKMVLSGFVHISLGLSLGVVFFSLFVAIMASIFVGKKSKKARIKKAKS